MDQNPGRRRSLPGSYIHSFRPESRGHCREPRDHRRRRTHLTTSFSLSSSRRCRCITDSMMRRSSSVRCDRSGAAGAAIVRPRP